MKEKKSLWLGSLSGYNARIASLMSLLVFSGALITRCTKEPYRISDSDPLAAFGIENITPANFEDSVVLDPEIILTFADETVTSEIASVKVSLNGNGTTLDGIATTSGKTATFTFDKDLMPMTDYTATVFASPESKGSSSWGDRKYSWKFRTGNHYRRKPVSVISVNPSKDASGVPVNTDLKIKINQALTPQLINILSLDLKKEQTPVMGTLEYSGNEITFTPTNPLGPGVKYTASVTFGNYDVYNDNNASFIWTFTTLPEKTPDIIAPAVSSVSPANEATAVSLNTSLSVTFSEAMDASTINNSTITLKQGTASVAGSVSYSQNVATFTPSAALDGNTVYTATVTTGVKDVEGNPLASTYSWSFTTSGIADVTAPTVSVVNPAVNATGIALNSTLTIKFNEVMNTGTISATNITLKQGTTPVTGTVTYASSTNTATFTPSAALAGGTVYTATVTTGVKDAAGNSMTSNYSWSFTTTAVVAGVSFSGEVVPILNKCNTCHTHGWTPSTNASTFYTNLVNANYVNPASPSSSKIYSRINSGHPSSTVTSAEKTKILTWMSEGSKNN